MWGWMPRETVGVTSPKHPSGDKCPGAQSAFSLGFNMLSKLSEGQARQLGRALEKWRCGFRVLSGLGMLWTRSRSHYAGFQVSRVIGISQDYLKGVTECNTMIFLAGFVLDEIRIL